MYLIQVGGRLAAIFCLVFFLLLFLLAGIVQARDVSFVWTPNEETIDGYRLYYKTGASGPPYDGTGASEGSSPVATGNVSAFTLHGLSDTETYYFALTAYLGAEESGYSTEIVLPAGTAAPPPGSRNVTFVWQPNDEPVDGYRLYYKDVDIGTPCPDPGAVAYDGTGADEGPSPVDTGNVSTFTLHGLSLDRTYCFALTAYAGVAESGHTPVVKLTGNEPPTATGSTLSTPMNVPASGTLQASDPEGDPLTWSIVNNGSKGTAVITNTSTGTFTYTPNANATGSDSFTFKVNDGRSDSNTATVSVTIVFVNDPPTAIPTSFTVAEDSDYTGQLGGTDPNGDSLTWSIVSNGSRGTASITNSATGAFTYTPSQDESGADSFTFKVNDGTVDSGPATVSVTITPVNDPPVAPDATLTVDEDGSGSGQLPGDDPDGDSLTWSIVSNGSKGTATITNGSTGAYTYTPDQDENGTDTFTYRVNDGAENSNIATVTVTITPVNDPPTANDITLSATEDTVASGQLSGTDPDGDTLLYAIVTNGVRGTAAITNPSSGAFTYTPNPDESGSDTFTYKVNDGTVDSPSATVSVTIAPVNDAPAAASYFFTTDEDTQHSGQLSGSDPEGDALTFSLVTNGTRGTAAITNPSSGAFTYTPNPDENGTDTFTFKVNDGAADSNTATVTVTITPVNDPPSAADSSLSVTEDVTATGRLGGSDPDDDPLTFAVVTEPQKGTVAITDPATGDYTYDPLPDVSGTDTFTFKVNDGSVDSPEATVTVTIAGVNDPPEAAGISISTPLNTAYSGRLFGGDVDGDALTYGIVTNGSLGTATVTDPAAGNFTYVPALDSSGDDTFTFKVHDGTADSPETTVRVRIFDELTQSAVFGDVDSSDNPGTITDTYAALDDQPHDGEETLRVSSWSPQPPHHPAGTIVLRADLSAIPSYATIMEARLFLYQTAATGTSGYTTTIHRITGVNPVVSQVTGYVAFTGRQWTSVPPGTTSNDIPLGLADTDVQEDEALLFGQTGYRSFVISTMAQEWVKDPATNYGLLIRGGDTLVETMREFGASENPNQAQRPYLVVRYRLIPPPPKLIMIEEIK